MIRAIFWLFAVFLLLKVLWNVAVPYVLVVRGYKSRAAQSKGISLMPLLDVVLMAACVTLAFGAGAAWPFGAKEVLVAGIAILLGSYVHLFVAGAIASWIARVLRKRT